MTTNAIQPSFTPPDLKYSKDKSSQGSRRGTCGCIILSGSNKNSIEVVDKPNEPYTEIRTARAYDADIPKYRIPKTNNLKNRYS